MKQKKIIPVENQSIRQKIDRDITRRIDSIINKKMQKAFLSIDKFTHSIMQNIERSITKDTRQNLDYNSFSKSLNFSSQQMIYNFALQIKKVLIKNI